VVAVIMMLRRYVLILGFLEELGGAVWGAVWGGFCIFSLVGARRERIALYITLHLNILPSAHAIPDSKYAF